MRKHPPSSQGSSKNSRNPRERHVSIRSVRRDPPDLERIARTISDLVLYLAQTDQTLEDYHAAVARHREIEASLRRSPSRPRPGQPLPGCSCRDCIDAQSRLDHGSSHVA